MICAKSDVCAAGVVPTLFKVGVIIVVGSKLVGCLVGSIVVPTNPSVRLKVVALSRPTYKRQVERHLGCVAGRKIIVVVPFCGLLHAKVLVEWQTAFALLVEAKVLRINTVGRCRKGYHRKELQQQSFGLCGSVYVVIANLHSRKVLCS